MLPAPIGNGLEGGFKAAHHCLANKGQALASCSPSVRSAQPHARACVICGDKQDPSILECGDDLALSAAMQFVAPSLEIPHCAAGHASRLSQGILCPIEQSSCSPALGTGQHTHDTRLFWKKPIILVELV